MNNKYILKEVMLDSSDIMEMLYEQSQESLFDLIKTIDLEVCQDFGFTEMCARYFVSEMLKLKDEDEQDFTEFGKFLKKYCKGEPEMISERQANSSGNTSFNSVTGDSLVSKTGNQKAFEEGWSLIWGKKEPEKIPLDGWVDEEDKQQFKQQATDDSFKCNIIEQHFLTEELPSGIIADET